MAQTTDPIPQTRVKSSLLRSFGYNPDTHTLAVVFKDGGCVEYAEVAEDVADAFGAALSKGQFFHRNIRGKFTGRKVERDPRIGICVTCGAEGIIGEMCADCERAVCT